jgi:oxalyl-CoA decarboxylase
LVVDALKANDVQTIYGVVGIPITDVARVAQASGVRYIGFGMRAMRVTRRRQRGS